MHIDDPVILVNGVVITLDQAPTLLDGTTMVPVIAFYELVANISWDGDTQTVTITP